MHTRWFLVCCFSSFISLFHCNFDTIQQNLAINSKAFWSQKDIHVGLNAALMCGRHVAPTQKRLLCLCSNYHNSLLKLLVSYRPYFSFLFLLLSICCRSCIFHSCIFHPLLSPPDFPLLHFQSPRNKVGLFCNAGPQRLTNLQSRTMQWGKTTSLTGQKRRDKTLCRTKQVRGTILMRKEREEMHEQGWRGCLLQFIAVYRR